MFSTSSVDSYNRIVSAHGIGMVFLFVMPMLISFAGNWSLPQSYLALDFAVPRINLASFYSLLTASCILVLAISREEGVSAGWTLYAPLSDSTYHSSSAVTLAILSLHILGLSSEGGSITFLVSLALSRSSGCFSILYCLFTWTIIAASVLLVLTLPVLGAGITILLLDRLANTVFLSPQLSGDPVMFQHLFWYFGHPEVYVIILPAFGIVSSTICRYTRVSVSGHFGMVLAILAISLVGFFVWAHHMFVAGISEDARLYFSSATMVIAIPTATKIFSWSSSLVNSSMITLELLIVIIFLVCFTLGGFTGLVLSNCSIDILYHDTYYVVGHFHYVLSIAALIGVILIVRLFVKLSLSSSGSQVLARFSMICLISGVNWLFGTQHLIGIDGHPRRIFHSSEAHQIVSDVANLSLPSLIAGLVFFISSISYLVTNTVSVWSYTAVFSAIYTHRVCLAVLTSSRASLHEL